MPWNFNKGELRGSAQQEIPALDIIIFAASIFATNNPQEDNMKSKRNLATNGGNVSANFFEFGER